MKFGCFGFIRHIPLIEQAGYDTAELDICEINALSDDAFKRLLDRASASSLSFEVFSGLIPLTERIHSKGFSRSRWLAHVEQAASRISLLGARLVPFGAGRCRSIPEHCDDMEAACETVISLVREICLILDKYGIDLAVEPLGPANSNYINRIEEAVTFAQKTGAGNCHVMCDLRHMLASGDDLDAIGRHISSIRHVHIDYPLGKQRRFPLKGDGFNYETYFKALHKAGYEGIMAIEATDCNDYLTEAAKSLSFLKDCDSRCKAVTVHT